MDWNFNIGWLIFGILVLVAGILIVVYYQTISDRLASGVSSYDRVKLVGIITAIVGIIIMTNLHTLLLSLFVNLVFKR